MARLPTHEELRARLHYDPETGNWTWLSHAGRAGIGGRAGVIDKHGYLIIRLFGSYLSAHRLAVFYMTGSWPEDVVDHRRVGKEFRADNRWSELREATHAQNMANRKAWGKSGYKGVTWHKGREKWQAQITVGGKTRSILYSDDPAVAYAAYLAEARKVSGEFAHG